jgi:hypothetical protein
MKKIKQINVAEHGVFPFSHRLKKRYDLEDYTDINEPCFFWGVIGETNKINNHRGLKLVKFLTPSDCELINELNDCDNLYIVSDPFFETEKPYKFASIEFEFSDFSIFQPTTLEDKIYCYMRDPLEFRKDILLRIQKKINYEIIYGGEVRDARYYETLEDLKTKYYDKCFLSINLSSKHGYTTVRELGCMGIKTIMWSPYKFPSIIQLDYFERDLKGNGSTIRVDEDEIVDKINKESYIIGNINHRMDPHNIKDEWLYVDFWKKNEYIKYK